MKEHGRSDVTMLNYDDAGHYVGGMVPNLPDPPAPRLATARRFYVGGTPLADAKARADSWPKLLAFLSNVPRRGR